jgi:hypothetical protein
MQKLGTIRKNGAIYVVCWVEGDRIIIPATGTLIATDTRDRSEALEICLHNFSNFEEIKG